MVYTRIKICGITSVDDAKVAVAAGVDALGFVFYEASPRAVSIAQAAEIVKSLPAFVTVVALFVNASTEDVNQTLEQLPVDLLQFHGDESPEYCRQFCRPYMKAVRVRPDVDLVELIEAYTDARALLLDSWKQGVPGGTGISFDWQLAQGDYSRPLVLAGGLNDSNVAQAIELLQPSAVDISGGVESSPGKKDAGKIARFVAAVRAADDAKMVV